jgi:uncharacterized phiE125 gp8 family phage protein
MVLDQDWELTLVTPSTGLPVNLAEAKDQLRVRHNDEDTLILRKVRAATNFCQNLVSGHKQFRNATFDMAMEGFPSNDSRIPLPVVPLSTSAAPIVTYYDSDNTKQTFSSTKYHVINPTWTQGYLEPINGETWPSSYSRPDAVTIRFVAGYDSESDVPEATKEAVLMVTGHLYRTREATLTGEGRIGSQEIAMGVKALLGGEQYGAYS